MGSLCTLWAPMGLCGSLCGLYTLYGVPIGLYGSQCVSMGPNVVFMHSMGSLWVSIGLYGSLCGLFAVYGVPMGV